MSVAKKGWCSNLQELMNARGLRDRKKAATANALAEAAYELAMERGLDGFVVEDVVQRAGYARRTFANHFSCKEEAVVAAAVTFHGYEEAEDLLARLPEDTPPLDLLRQLTKMRLTAELLMKMRGLVTMSKRYPTLTPYILSIHRLLQNEAQQVLSGFSRGRYPEGYPHLLTGAVFGALLPLLDGTLNVLLPGQPAAEAPGAKTFEEYLETMFGLLKNGF
ncbi:TetR/AcrR family transcriptional regulator [Cohnella caldifontis]|uniref:TetR/AcrR family transcriptional regulator n=1 Tax=Cohnella caldifontis TaxID=3027471 RepID=UPI0023EC15D2|nr:TetR/AcrR family transcriptional regulator [Cohnella sp. YIM B05605]